MPSLQIRITYLLLFGLLLRYTRLTRSTPQGVPVAINFCRLSPALIVSLILKFIRSPPSPKSYISVLCVVNSFYHLHGQWNGKVGQFREHTVWKIIIRGAAKQTGRLKIQKASKNINPSLGDGKSMARMF